VIKRETANRVRGRIETIIAKNANIDDPDFRNPAELTKRSVKSCRSGPSASFVTAAAARG